MKRILIDTDPGVDDAHAILMALAHPNVEVVAITTVNGNVGVDKTTANALKILDVANKDIPVFAGCSKPLVSEPYHASYVHGKDGLGDCGIPPSQRTVQTEHAVQALIQLSKEHAGELSLVTIGPLTNVAVAMQLDPDLPKRFEKLVIMAGAIYAKGNTKMCAEFNVYADPEAAQIVLDGWGKLSMLSWETTVAHAIGPADLDHLLSLGTPKAEFIGKTNQKFLELTKSRLGGQRKLFAPDALAVAAAMEPEIVIKAEEHYVAVELSGQLTRGLTVVDWSNTSQKPANVEIILEVNQQRFLELMEDALR